MSNESKFSAFIKTAGEEIKQSVLSKWIGCFVALGAVLFTFIQIITYSLVAKQDFNAGGIVFSVFGILFFVALSLFRKTSPFAPIALMICDFAALLMFVGNIIDYFSTAFFGGFSAAAFFGMPAQYWLSTICFVLSFIISSVAVYLPQNRELKAKTEEVEEEVNEEVQSNEEN